MILYIFNLHDAVGDLELKQLFMPFGEVKTAQVVRDIISGGSKGFGYVELENDKAAQNAITHLNGLAFETFTIYVEEKKPSGATITESNNHFHPIGFNKN